MATITADSVGGSKNVIAGLDMIAFSEIGVALLAKSDNGYNVIVGSTPQKPILFTDYRSHPNVRMPFKRMDGVTDYSTAAGRYQTLYRYAVAYMKSLKLPDFGKLSQDRIALQLMRECGAYQLLKDGKITEAIKALSSRWASFPGNLYGQHVNEVEALEAAYVSAGGLLVAG